MTLISMSLGLVANNRFSYKVSAQDH